MSSGKRFEVLRAIEKFVALRNFAPTVDELTFMVSIKSKSSVVNALNRLIADGYLARKKGTPRGLRVLRSAPKNYEAANTTEKEINSKKAKAARDALRARRLQAEKKDRRAGEVDCFTAAVALGKLNDARERGESLLHDPRSLFHSGRVRARKIG